VANTLIRNIPLQSKMASSTLWHSFMEGLRQRLYFYICKTDICFPKCYF